MKTCSVDGCTRKHLARGYCRAHYAERIERTDATRRTTTDIHLEDIEWMAETGETWSNAAARLGLKPNSLARRLERAGRQDLITRLRSRDHAA